MHKIKKKFLNPLRFYMRLSSCAYSQYINSSIFLHAKCIYESNCKIINLIEKHVELIPYEIQFDCVRLLNHYQIWVIQYLELEKAIIPSAKTEFVFVRHDSFGAFPFESSNKILEFIDKTV